MKLAIKFISPFLIHSVFSLGAVRLQLPWYKRLHPFFYVSRVKPALCLQPFHALLLPRSSIDPLYHSVQYLADWEGYGAEEKSCSPDCHILDAKQHPDHPATEFVHQELHVYPHM